MSKLKEMLDKYRNSGSVKLKVGIMADKTYPEDGEYVANVGYANEYGQGNIPSRPFFRTAIENNRRTLPQMAASLLNKHDLETALRLLGEHMADELAESVNTWEEPPNAPYTIEKKGFNAPLRDTKDLLRSFTFEIEK